jgi:hypothetical protein
MTTKEKKEYKKELEEMKIFAKRLSEDKEEALRIFQKAGICTPTGKLTKRYR